MATTQFLVSNETGADLYVYDFNYGEPSAVTPLGALEPRKPPLPVPLQPNAERRLYFSEKRLEKSLEIGKPPDPFNATVDGSVMFSFAEYNYEPANSRFTFDLSYIDVFSYPVTVQFSNLGTYKGAVANHEYGPTSLSEIETQLGAQTDYDWSALVWPLTNVKTKFLPKFPKGIQRVIGPNKAWQGELADGSIGPWVPTTYEAFFSSLPKSGKQLFASQTNWLGWQDLTQSGTPSPSGTGYVKAMHAAATPDSNGKFGFFCYPRDNTAGEFTWVPDSATCLVKVYGVPAYTS